METKDNNVERKPGFVPDGELNYPSANAAFNAWVNATGQTMPAAEKRRKFKIWLKDMKDSGKLDKLVRNPLAANDLAKTHHNVEGDKKPEIAETKEEVKVETKTEDKKPAKGWSPAKIAGAVIIGGLVVWGIIEVVKLVKKNKAGNAG